MQYRDYYGGQPPVAPFTKRRYSGGLRYAGLSGMTDEYGNQLPRYGAMGPQRSGPGLSWDQNRFRGSGQEFSPRVPYGSALPPWMQYGIGGPRRRGVSTYQGFTLPPAQPQPPWMQYGGGYAQQPQQPPMQNVPFYGFDQLPPYVLK